MSDAANLNGVDLERALVQRLRYEHALGIQTVHPVALVPLAAPAAESPSPPAVTPARPADPPAETPESDDPRSKEERWRELEARAKACTQCGLRKGCRNVVFGTGNRNAKLVFVGEGPGEDEDRQGEPFVGRAGQLLNRIIAALGLKREDVYICNVVLCRPPDNRKPLPDEVAACAPFLNGQLDLIAPKVIVALGGTAAQALLKTTQGIMSIRGRWFSYRGIPVMPTYHPAFLLRSYTEANRRAVWDDMKKALEKSKE